MGIGEKEGDWPVFDTDIINTFILPTAQITAQPPSNISTHTSAAEGLMHFST